VGTVVNPTVFSCDWKWRDTSPKHFLCQSNCSGSLKVCDSPWSDVSLRVLI